MWMHTHTEVKTHWFCKCLWIKADFPYFFLYFHIFNLLFLLPSGSFFKVTIIFVCTKENDSGNINLVRTTKNNYIFQFDTRLACPPHRDNCVVQDRLGNQYDLSQLTRQKGNWKVRVGNMQYIINICSPINDYTGNTTCAGKFQLVNCKQQGSMAVGVCYSTHPTKQGHDPVLIIASFCRGTIIQCVLPCFFKIIAWLGRNI